MRSLLGTLARSSIVCEHACVLWRELCRLPLGIGSHFRRGQAQVACTHGHQLSWPLPPHTCSRQRAATTIWRQWHRAQHAGARAARRQEDTSLRK